MRPLPSPADLARWAFYVHARRGLSPAWPALFEHLRQAGVLSTLRRGEARALLQDELRRCGLPDVVDAAWAVQYRVALDELALGRHTPDTLGAFLRFEGLHHLDEARARGKGVVWAFPHAGAVMLMLAGLVQLGHPVAQVAARGLAPREVAEAHPELLGHNPWREDVRRARESDEDRIGATFVDLSRSPRELYRTLEQNGVVCIAFDGRIGARWIQRPFLRRVANLNPGAFRLAASTGAALLPAFVDSTGRGPSIVRVGPAIHTSDVEESLANTLAFAERHIRHTPAAYGAWLLHCRRRAAVDDHPLFEDQRARR